MLISFLHKNLLANNDNNPIGARSAGMSNSSVTLSDIWSVSHNQAGLAYVNHITAGISYENRFLIPELSLKGGAFALPTKSGVFGLSYTYFGYSKYNESKVGLAYSKTLGKYISLGIQLDYLYTHIAEQYGNQGTAVGEIGILSQPVKNLYIGAHIFNPTRSKITNYNNEKIPTIIKLGLAYNFSDKVLLSTETEKDLDNKAIFRAGIEYHILEKIYLRTGISSDPVQNSFGLGLVLKNLKIDIAFVTHQILGITPHASVYYEF